MKKTNIVRRIDDLGCIVIPEEIRSATKIRDGELLEIFIEDNKIILQKYEPTTIYSLIDNLQEALKDENRPDLAQMVNMIGTIFKGE